MFEDMYNSKQKDFDSVVCRVRPNQRLRMWMGCQVLAACRYPQIRSEKMLENMTMICTFPILLAIPPVFKRKLVQQLVAEGVIITANSSPQLLSAHNIALNSNTLLRALSKIQCEQAILMVHGLKEKQFSMYDVDLIPCPTNRVDVALIQNIGLIELYEKRTDHEKLYPMAFGSIDLMYDGLGSIESSHKIYPTKAYSTVVHALKLGGGHINRKIFRFTYKRMRNGLASLKKVMNFMENSSFQPKMRFQLSFLQDLQKISSFQGFLRRASMQVIQASNSFSQLHQGDRCLGFSTYCAYVSQQLAEFDTIFYGTNTNSVSPFHKKKYGQLLQAFGFTDYYLTSLADLYPQAPYRPIVQKSSITVQSSNQMDIQPLIGALLPIQEVVEDSSQVRQNQAGLANEATTKPIKKLSRQQKDRQARQKKRQAYQKAKASK